MSEPTDAGTTGTTATPAHDAEQLERTVLEVKRVIVGQDRLVERMLVGLLAKGHLLLEGVPGVAKTLAVETFARVVGGSFARIQFTPDLVPADILGTRIYRQGREQFLPFIVTVVAILFTDLLIGVVIGVIYAIYFLIKHTLEAGYILRQHHEGHIQHYTVDLALNVSFLNKKRIMEMLDKMPEYSVVKINGADSLYIDSDILEIFHDFKSKAHRKHIQLTMINIPDVETIELH
jgi:hypothetical protein